MILSSEQTISAVRTILEEQVLPTLETADWTASNIRACLLLLTYAEDCAGMERSLLTETNKAMATFFRFASSSREAGWLDPRAHAAIVSTATAIDAISSDASTSELLALNGSAKQLLSDIVLGAADARKADRGGEGEFHLALHRCLHVLRTADAALTERARKMLPI